MASATACALGRETQRAMRYPGHKFLGNHLDDDATDRGDHGEMTSHEPPDLLRFEQNDYGNSRRLLALHDNDLRYCPPMRSWLLWNGQRWEIDQRDQIRRLAQDAMLLFVEQAMEIKNEALTRFASTSLNSARISSLIREAQPMVTVLPCDLDTHHYSINFL